MAKLGTDIKEEATETQKVETPKAPSKASADRDARGVGPKVKKRVLSKRVRAQHRRSGSKLSLRQWAERRLEHDADVAEWLKNKVV